jgi:hypothetical protein
MATPLYPTFEQRVDDAVERILTKQVEPWAFFNAGPPMRVTRFDGRGIAYQGIEFEGSPREIFWSRYIEPFLEDLTVQEISAAVAAARERGVDAKLLLPELEGLLLSSCKKVFNRMAEIDQRLRGKGFPQSVRQRSIEDKYSRMKEFIERRIRAEIEMWQPKGRKGGEKREGRKGDILHFEGRKGDILHFDFFPRSSSRS